MRILETAPLAERIALLARESRYGIGMAELVARTGLLEADHPKSRRLTHLVTVLESAAVLAARSRHGWRASWKRLHEHLKQFHRQNPLLAGVSKEELRSKFLPARRPG